jgi:hypothetical protein
VTLGIGAHLNLKEGKGRRYFSVEPGDWCAMLLVTLDLI